MRLIQETVCVQSPPTFSSNAVHSNDMFLLKQQYAWIHLKFNPHTQHPCHFCQSLGAEFDPTPYQAPHA